ncbi:MAG: hypothetical protein EDX89_05590 [Acidobacteria bacterium]|nr:MAG: hypothetical protein EDX89_05590 [Acidobacteriota bacterium]MCE7956357.1 hypothetical protein [Acidobacteria bacterium ACB2]
MHLQSGSLGWRTDDLLLVGRDQSGDARRAALQAKCRFRFRRSDEASVSALAKAWADFNDAQRFDPDRDVLGLVLQAASSDFTHGLRALLDCARASVDEGDFDRRLKIPGYLPKEALKYREACREMLEGATGGAIPEDRLLAFLRVLDFVCLDLGPDAGAAEASIRTILQVAADTTPGTPQTDTWPEMVAAALRWDGRAQSVTASDVAREVGWPALPRSAPFQKALESLRSTTDVVLCRVTASIQGVEVRRAQLEAELLGLVNSGGIVVVAGEPGAGKSVLAGHAFREVRDDGIALAFRPGMLASGGYLDGVLLPHGQTTARLLATGALFPRNIVLVESAEQFLEKADPERDPLRDLLATLGEDPSWVVLITCRSFAVETFRSAFLEGAARPVSVLKVPEFSDADLGVVATAIPALATPLGEPRLRRLLRNPFKLGMAARMTWAAPLPTDARGFRRKVWSEVVRCDSYQAGGMPTRRERAFLEVVRRRARSLAVFVRCDDLDAAVLQELRRDMLVVASPDDPDALAPADDVLEDWALQRWIEDEFTAAARVPGDFFGRIGTHPAIRRAFRVWLTEWLDGAFDEAAAWALGVARSAGLARHWVDDTLTGALLSRAGGRFVETIASAEQFRTDGLLHRLLHLTRVACRRLPSAAHEPGLVGTRLLLPDGGAWEALLSWLDKVPKDGLEPPAIPLYLNLLEDWALRVTPRSPYPAGSDAAGRTGLRIAARAPERSYSERHDAEERALAVALRVPNVAADDLQALVQTAVGAGTPRRESTIVKLLLGIVTGAAAARDLPQLAVACVEHVFGMSPGAEAARRPDWEDHDMHAVETAFGIPPNGRELGFPPSGLHGPFCHLLAHHPTIGLDLIVRITNHACDAYGAADVRLLEAPGRITLSLPDGRAVEQWINGRLWGLYRSATVGPYPLQCALMALENWLLERAEAEDPTLEAALLDLLSRSNNAAITAVVLSVAQAWPQGTWRTILPLLAHREFFELDRGRWIADQGSAGRILEGIGFRSAPEDEWYAKERRRSNAREHRKEDLEATAVRLQLTDAREQVWALVDGLRAALPAEASRTDDDRLWELVLHRIDVRRFLPAGPAAEGRVLMQASPPPPEVARLLHARRPLMEAHTSRLSLLMWATTVFERRSATGYDPSAWREKLGEAVRFSNDGPVDEEFSDPTSSAPPYVAAVCLRDHWEELSEAERDWCVDEACRSVVASTDDEFSLGGESAHALDGSMAAANVLPGLVAKVRGTPIEATVLRALACGVLHAKGGYVEVTMAGIGRDLLLSDRDLALTCLKAGVAYARLMQERGRQWAWQDTAGKQRARAELRGIVERRERWEDPEVLGALDYTRWPWWGLVKNLLAVFGSQPTDELSRICFRRLAELLARSWTAERRSFPTGPNDDDEDGRFEAGARHDVSGALASMVLAHRPDAALAITQPILAATGDAPREVGDFIRDLLSAQDGRGPSDTFVALWRAFATRYEETARGGGRERNELLRCLFFDISWKPGVREWEPLKGHEGEVGALFRRLPPSDQLLEVFAGFLRTVGSAIVPDALADVAEKLAEGAGRVQLTSGAIQRLDAVLSRLIYGGSPRIRRDERLRSGVLALLDAMIEGGSSSAYRMRDDFLTPLAPR